MSTEADKQSSLLKHSQRLWPLSLVAMILAMITLACGFFGPNSGNSIALQTRLPTLTRTPLPTLTPTASVTGAAPELAAPADPAVQPTPEVARVDSAAGEVAAVALAVETPTATSYPRPGPTESREGQIEDQPQQITAPPPTGTPTEPPPTSPPATTATESPSPTSTPTATPTETPLPEDWVFSNVRVSPDQNGENLLLYGDVLNSTGVSQEMAYITGIFFDAQKQVIADEDSIFDYWPVAVVPPGGQVPFELIVEGIQNAADYNLNVQAEPSNHTPRQDFEFLDHGTSNEGEEYCVAGRLRNQGSTLEDDLVIVVILYDDQDQVVSYGEYYEPFPAAVTKDGTLDFEVCADPDDQSIARYELRAWGG